MTSGITGLNSYAQYGSAYARAAVAQTSLAGVLAAGSDDPFTQSNAATNLTLSAAARAQLANAASTKDFAAVISDSRAALDALYKAAGVKAPYDSSGKPTIELSSLDRRALFAIASNAGGQFTDDEQNLAGAERLSPLQRRAVAGGADREAHRRFRHGVHRCGDLSRCRQQRGEGHRHLADRARGGREGAHGDAERSLEGAVRHQQRSGGGVSGAISGRQQHHDAKLLLGGKGGARQARRAGQRGCRRRQGAGVRCRPQDRAARRPVVVRQPLAVGDRAQPGSAVLGAGELRRQADARRPQPRRRS